VRESLVTADKWSEYFTALAFVALRACTWEARSLGARRLMFMLSAYAFGELKHAEEVSSSDKRGDETAADESRMG
jgi:hypothetical protein